MLAPRRLRCWSIFRGRMIAPASTLSSVDFSVRRLRKGVLLSFFAVISKARGANFNVRLNLYRGALAELGAVLVV